VAAAVPAEGHDRGRRHADGSAARRPSSGRPLGREAVCRFPARRHEAPRQGLGPAAVRRLARPRRRGGYGESALATHLARARSSEAQSARTRVVVKQSLRWYERSTTWVFFRRLGLAAWAACHRSAALFLLKRSWGLVLGGLFGGKDAASASGESGTKRERGPARLLPGLAQLLSLAVTALRLVEDLARLNVAADDQSRRRPFSGSSPLWGEAAAAAASSSEGTGSPSMSSSWSRGKTTSPPGSVSSKGAAFFSWGAPVWRHLR